MKYDLFTAVNQVYGQGVSRESPLEVVKFRDQ